MRSCLERKKIGFIRTLFGVLGLCIVVATDPAAADGVSRTFFETLQKRLIADGFDEQRIKQLYQSEQVFFETRGVTQYFLHNEAKLNYDRLTRKSLIREGRAYMETHAEAFAKAEDQFKDNSRIITAIILVETRFGRSLGTKSIINTLSTMAVLSESEPREYLWEQLPAKQRFERTLYDQKADQKATWAYNELKAFLTYTELHRMDPLEIIGSYAGALGIAQFMPSNIIPYGKDGNDDGHINLFDDADAIMSIASYLKHYGWKPGINEKEASKVIYHYNHSGYYVRTILKIADLLES